MDINIIKTVPLPEPEKDWDLILGLKHFVNNLFFKNEVQSNSQASSFKKPSDSGELEPNDRTEAPKFEPIAKVSQLSSQSVENQPNYLDGNLIVDPILSPLYTIDSTPENSLEKNPKSVFTYEPKKDEVSQGSNENVEKTSENRSENLLVKQTLLPYRKEIDDSTVRIDELENQVVCELREKDEKKLKGWAHRRQERVKKLVGEKTWRDLENLMRWCQGEAVEKLITDLSIGRSGFYYRLEQFLLRLPEVFADQRKHNGRQTALTDEMVGRIVEIIVGEPLISPEEISQRLFRQDGSKVSTSVITDYIKHAQLTNYRGTSYRETTLPVVKEMADNFSRYSTHLLQIPALEQLGFYQTISILDVTNPQSYYSNDIRCHTIVAALSCGKTRLYHTGELVEDEFGRLLGENRYPSQSDLHTYLDKIVAEDQAQRDKGLTEEKCLVNQFIRESQRQIASASGAGIGKAIYVDPHIIALHTAKPVAKTKHGVQNRIVKAIVKLGVVSAKQPGRPLVFQLEAGDISFEDELEKIVELTSFTTGDPVELVGIDRGALSQAVLEQFENRGTGLLVWSKDTPTMRRELAAIAPRCFEDAEYETIRRQDGQQVRRLKNRVADIAEMTINSNNYSCRTIVVEDVRSHRRIGIHAVGKPTQNMSAKQILAFMRGKQWVEENFKQNIVWGGDAFCGGNIMPELRRQRPDEEELKELKVEARRLKERYQANILEEKTVIQKWQDGEQTKRHTNDLLKGIRRRGQSIKTQWKQTEALIKWGITNKVPEKQIRWQVDTRKMQIMSQFQDYARLARQDTMMLLRRFLKQAIIESTIAEHEGKINAPSSHAISVEAEKVLERMPWGQLETRFFEQGGWVEKNKDQKIMHVRLAPFKNPLLQRATQLLCEYLNQQQPIMRCQDGEYILRYAC